MKPLILLLLGPGLGLTGIISAAEDSKATDNQNFLPHVLSECSEKERSFLAQLNEKRGDGPLLASLDVVLSPARLRAEGYSFPGPTLTSKDADYIRKRLAWEGTFGAADHPRRLLVFASTALFPLPAGHRPATIVLTTASYQLISWRTAGRGAVFQGASVRPEGNGFGLALSFLQLRPSRKLEIAFEVSSAGINHDYSTADPADTGVPDWVEPMGPRVTKADCETLARKIAAGMSRAGMEEILKPYRPIPLPGGGQGGPQMTRYLFNVDCQMVVWFTLARDGAEPINDPSIRKPADVVAIEPVTISRPFLCGTDEDLERWRASVARDAKLAP